MIDDPETTRDPGFYSDKRLLQELAEWKIEIERRIRRLETAVEVIQIRRDKGPAASGHGA